MKNLLSLLFFVVMFSSMHAQTGEITGFVTDPSTDSAIQYASILAFNNTQFLTTITDHKGLYYIKPAPPGNYTLHVYYQGDTAIVQNIVVNGNSTVEVNVDFTVAHMLGPVDIITHDIPLIDRFNPDPGSSLSSVQIDESPAISITAMLETFDDVYIDNGAIQIRAARPEATKVIIDGMPLMQPRIDIPMSSIAKLEVLSGSIPARYGDFIGGVIVIETKGY